MIMRVKLHQDGIVASADAVQRLDFSVLRAHSNWSVTVNFGDGDVTIAEVDWRSAPSYTIRTEVSDRVGPERIRLHNHIVPMVLIRLLRLFVAGRLHWRHPTQPLVTVTPVNH